MTLIHQDHSYMVYSRLDLPGKARTFRECTCHIERLEHCVCKYTVHWGSHKVSQHQSGFPFRHNHIWCNRVDCRYWESDIQACTGRIELRLRWLCNDTCRLPYQSQDVAHDHKCLHWENHRDHSRKGHTCLDQSNPCFGHDRILQCIFRIWYPQCCADTRHRHHRMFHCLLYRRLDQSGIYQSGCDSCKLNIY